MSATNNLLIDLPKIQQYLSNNKNQENEPNKLKFDVRSKQDLDKSEDGEWIWYKNINLPNFYVSITSKDKLQLKLKASISGISELKADQPQL